MVKLLGTCDINIQQEEVISSIPQEEAVLL
jgi:hypothetical protein